MKSQPELQTYFGREVWVNPTTEAIRDAECLCMNCDLLKPGKNDNCGIAKTLYAVCVNNDVALAVTRCPLWKPK